VDPDGLVAAGLARKGTPVKVLGQGEVSVALQIRAHAFSATAASKIAAAGGTVEVV
jgi:large subunit ribosomal protein L15